MAMHDQDNADRDNAPEPADEKHRQQNRPPDDAFAQIGLHQNEKARRADDGAAQKQPQHRMHLPKLTQEKRQHHDARDHRELRRLEIDRPEMEPAARAVDLRADEFGQDQEEKPGQIHRQRAPPDPAIVDQARDHEGEQTRPRPSSPVFARIRRRPASSRM